MVGSGIGIGTSLAANFIGGAVGSALEQKIGSGSVSLKESLVLAYASCTLQETNIIPVTIRHSFSDPVG